MLRVALVFAAALAAPLHAQNYLCEDVFHVDQAPAAEPVMPRPEVKLDPDIQRLLKYSLIESRHRLNGLASYYSNSLDGTLTANGERYHMKKFSAAHLTLPLGSWVEIKSKATGKKIRLRVNDRGPYVHKFIIDLSRTAARALGVDVAEDRTVMIRIIALPGERPLSDSVLAGPERVIAEEVDGR
ncbi:MAG: septal ring lytic transglycosylase RlpA family protein [Acidobacteriota bacterium]|nr:septal ring lytic transglycosylase RlpA family protein [Acidobacteriota bacterium]